MHIRTGSYLPPSTHLEHTLQRIQDWIRDRQQTHPRCEDSKSFHPFRLIDTTLKDPAQVKLVELPPESHVSQYACLSHCWGKTRSKHITTSSNVASNLVGILLSELPLTFQHAIHITRALKIPYLWIDSLCIVQDSAEDWRRHVSSMAAIYEEAFITLAAGASVNDDGGFFATPPTECQQPHSFRLNIDNSDFKFHIRHAIDHPDADWPAQEVLPLMERGWCFQERLLARRYLLFGSKEVLWECQEEVACSCSMADGSFNPRSTSNRPSFPECVPTKWQVAQLENSLDRDYASVWRNLVMAYSSRDITFARDKLPALDGLAVACQVCKPAHKLGR